MHFCQDSAPHSPDHDALNTSQLSGDRFSPLRALRSRAHAPCIARSRHTGRGARDRRAPPFTRPHLLTHRVVSIRHPPTVPSAARCLVERAVWLVPSASTGRMASERFGFMRRRSHVQHFPASMTVALGNAH